jgi:hypothetical protein
MMVRKITARKKPAFRPVLFLVATLGALYSGGRDVRAADINARVAAAQDLTHAFEYDAAARELDLAGAPDEPDIVVERARIELHKGNCDAAAAMLMRPAIAKVERAEEVSAIAKGCVRATAATILEKDEAAGVEVRFQDEHDRALFPLMVDTVVKAREAIARDLGTDFPKPTRIVVVRDALTLSVMTGLPYAAAQTTGTVAVAKWGRVTMISPRAGHHGYPWKDTLAHELTHLAVTRITHDHAPLWLQEGLAKHEETRWRPANPFDGRPTPESVVIRGIEKKLDLPLDKLGMSLAMLPSPEAAMVAYCEVTSFVRRLDAQSPDTLKKLLRELEHTTDASAALQKATGQDLPAWDKAWRAWLAEQPKGPLPSYFGLDAQEKDLTRTRDHARLAELLLERKHPDAALLELAKIKEEAFSVPELRSLRARALLAAGKKEEALAQVAEFKDVIASYGPWWAVRGAVQRVSPSPAAEQAEPSFAEAVAQDPFGVMAACKGAEVPDTAPAGQQPPPLLDPSTEALCQAARAWNFLP